MQYSRVIRSGAAVLSAIFALSAAGAPARAAPIPSRIVTAINTSDTVTLAGNTNPRAKPAADQGLVPAQQQLGHMFLVLERSPEQERDLAAFNARQYDPASLDYQHWLQPAEFGLMYGPNDADIATVTAWLQSSGLQVIHISQARTSIEFVGTAAQVQTAFHVQMHRYLTNGTAQISNDRDPQIPRALSPVVAGVSGLNNFPLRHDIEAGPSATLDSTKGRLARYTPPSPELAPPSVGIKPNFTVPYSGSGPDFEFVTPYDFATIYNSLPLWNASKPITGSGVTIAIVGENDINPSDISTFRSTFGLPPNVPSIEHVGTDPKGSSFGNTAELELAGAAAPGANLLLVVPDASDSSNSAITPSGFISVIQHIYEHDVNKVQIVTAGYNLCELSLGSSSNMLINQTWQNLQTAGISIFVSAGSMGSADCSAGAFRTPDTEGLQVSGVASSPFVTAVGGTDLAWNWLGGSITDYWNTTGTNNGNDAHYASAKGYIPEYPWNVSCANALVQEDLFVVNGTREWPYPIDVCNAYENNVEYEGLLTVQGGGGGASSCSSQNSNGTCSGYTKPTWQTGTGVPADGRRDLPDVSLFASAGWPAIHYLIPIPPSEIPPTSFIAATSIVICYSGSDAAYGAHPCTYSTYAKDIIFQSSGGSALSSSYWAGIMALVVQKQGGGRLGLANPTLYKLFGKESASACDTLTVTAGNSCVFYDLAANISNAQPCVAGSSTACNATQPGSGNTLAYGILSGYTANVGYDQATGLGSVNVTNLVNNWSKTSPSPTVSLSPTSLSFGSITVGSTAIQTLTIKNTGSVAVTFTTGGITLTGANAAAFSKTTTCGSSLVVGGSCSITLTFKPTAAGSDVATLSIADNASGAPQTVPLSGSGTSASGTPTIKVSTTSLAFGNQTIGAASPTKSVTVTNPGSISLKLSSITLTGQADDFVLTDGCGSSLAASASCTLTVAFKPVSAGSKAASISIADNASGSPQSVALTGTGVTGVTGGAAAIQISPTTLAFATQGVGTASASKTVTVTNSGTASLSLSSITLTGQADDFELTNGCAATLAAKSTCMFSVAFKPVSGGGKSASISIADNASGSPQTVALSGTGG
jgi:hypothetical protein